MIAVVRGRVGGRASRWMDGWIVTDAAVAVMYVEFVDTPLHVFLPSQICSIYLRLFCSCVLHLTVSYLPSALGAYVVYPGPHLPLPVCFAGQDLAPTRR